MLGGVVEALRQGGLAVSAAVKRLLGQVDRQIRRLIDQIHPETPILFDGLAFGALPPGFRTQLRDAGLGLLGEWLPLPEWLMFTGFLAVALIYFLMSRQRVSHLHAKVTASS